MRQDKNKISIFFFLGLESLSHFLGVRKRGAVEKYVSVKVSC